MYRNDDWFLLKILKGKAKNLDEIEK